MVHSNTINHPKSPHKMTAPGGGGSGSAMTGMAGSNANTMTNVGFAAAAGAASGGVVDYAGGNVADLFMGGIPEFEFTADNLERHNQKLAQQRIVQKQRKQQKYHQLTASSNINPKSFHHHQHQHQHLHHHHYVHPAPGPVPGPKADPLAHIVGGAMLPNNVSNGSAGLRGGTGSSLKLSQFSGLSHLSGISTQSEALSKVFHPGNRLQFSKFQRPETKGTALNKPNLNPESQYSTAAALDP